MSKHVVAQRGVAQSKKPLAANMSRKDSGGGGRRRRRKFVNGDTILLTIAIIPPMPPSPRVLIRVLSVGCQSPVSWHRRGRRGRGRTGLDGSRGGRQLSSPILSPHVARHRHPMQQYNDPLPLPNLRPMNHISRPPTRPVNPLCPRLLACRPNIRHRAHHPLRRSRYQELARGPADVHLVVPALVAHRLVRLHEPKRPYSAVDHGQCKTHRLVGQDKPRHTGSRTQRPCATRSRL